MLKRYSLILLIIFILIQFHRPGKTNPIVEGKSLQLPENISSVVKRACYDCHSNETIWPWYTNISPISIYIVNHVNNGRKEVNFSEWQNYKLKRKLRKLKEIGDQLREGEMPLESYLKIHDEAKLSAEEIKMICDWTEIEKKNLEVSDSSNTPKQ